MNKLKSYAASKRGRDTLLCFGIVIIAYIIVQAAIAGGGISSQIKGLLVPICAYVVMAISLNLTVGILGELSLGHAGFMSVGAFSGVIVSQSLLTAVPNAPVRLAIAMVVGAIFAAIVGVAYLRLRARGEGAADVSPAATAAAGPPTPNALKRAAYPQSPRESKMMFHTGVP